MSRSCRTPPQDTSQPVSKQIMPERCRFKRMNHSNTLRADATAASSDRRGRAKKTATVSCHCIHGVSTSCFLGSRCLRWPFFCEALRFLGARIFAAGSAQASITSSRHRSYHSTNLRLSTSRLTTFPASITTQKCLSMYREEASQLRLSAPISRLSVGRSVGRFVGRPIRPSVRRSVGLSVSRSVCLSRLSTQFRASPTCIGRA